MDTKPRIIGDRNRRLIRISYLLECTQNAFEVGFDLLAILVVLNVLVNF